VGRISPQNTRATGDGITKGVAGVENIFLIQAVDQYGNDFLFGNGDVKVTITGYFLISYLQFIIIDQINSINSINSIN